MSVQITIDLILSAIEEAPEADLGMLEEAIADRLQRSPRVSYPAYACRPLRPDESEADVLVGDLILLKVGEDSKWIDDPRITPKGTGGRISQRTQQIAGTLSQKVVK